MDRELRDKLKELNIETVDDLDAFISNAISNSSAEYIDGLSVMEDDFKDRCVFCNGTLTDSYMASEFNQKILASVCIDCGRISKWICVDTV